MKTLEQMGADQSAKVTAGREEILYQAARGWVWIKSREAYPRHPVIFSANDWDVQSPPEHSIWASLPCSGGEPGSLGIIGSYF